MKISSAELAFKFARCPVEILQVAGPLCFTTGVTQQLCKPAEVRECGPVRGKSQRNSIGPMLHPPACFPSKPTVGSQSSASMRSFRAHQIQLLFSPQTSKAKWPQTKMYLSSFDFFFHLVRGCVICDEESCSGKAVELVLLSLLDSVRLLPPGRLLWCPERLTLLCAAEVSWVSWSQRKLLLTTLDYNVRILSL